MFLCQRPPSFDLNAPVGYFNNPLKVSSNFNMEVSTNIPSTASKSPPGRNFPIDKFPLEIGMKICQLLSQFDCINLSLVCKPLYQCCFERLYQNIIIDKDFNRFDNEKEYQFFDELGVSCCYINNHYSFKKFIKTIRNSGKIFPIKQLQVVSLPTSLNIFEYYPDLLILFQNLHHLNKLVWLNDNFNVQWLRFLPNKSLITTLKLHMKDIHESSFIILKFPNLREFEFQPFKPHQLKNIGKFLNSDLRSLVLSKHSETNDNLLPNCYELVMVRDRESIIETIQRGTIHSKYYDIDLKSITKFVTNLPYLKCLTKLSIDNILVTSNDANLILDSINISNLTYLSLKGISEYQLLDHHDDTIKNSFLLKLVPFLKNLRHLALDYRESKMDSVPQFLDKLNKEKLESLDLTIRLNQTRDWRAVDGERAFYQHYGSIILSMKNLTRLSMEMKQELDNMVDGTNINVLANFPENLEFLKRLDHLTKLTTFRVNPSGNVDNILGVLPTMKLLEIIDIFGDKAGGSPNLGLGMVHPSIFDEWFKVQHIALAYWKQRKQLQYIRINSYIFECTTNVNPRNGLSRWFEEKVRV